MSFAELRALSPSDEKDEIDSLPSSSTSSEIYSEADSDAQAEWERSMEQLQLMLTMMVIPFVGKFLGRKFAYWSWTRYMGWYHGVDTRFTSKAAFNTVGAVEAASSL